MWNICAVREVFSKAGEVVAARRSNIILKNRYDSYFKQKIIVLALCTYLVNFFVCLGEGDSIVWYGIVLYRYTMLILSIISNRLCLVSPTSTICKYAPLP